MEFIGYNDNLSALYVSSISSRDLGMRVIIMGDECSF